MSDYTLRLAPSPTSTEVIGIDINPQVTDLRWSTATPVGFKQLDVGLSPNGSAPTVGGLQESLTIGPFRHVELWYCSTLVFEGRIVNRDYDGVGLAGFNAKGYGEVALSDKKINMGSGISIGPVGDFLERAISTGSRLITLDPWVKENIDNGVMYATGDASGLTVRQVVDMVTRQSLSGEAYDWWVYQGRALTVLPRVAPPAPHFAVPHEKGLTRWTEDDEHLWGEVEVFYTVDGVEFSVTATADGFYDTYEIERSTTLTIDRASHMGALGFARQWVTTHSVPLVRASVIRRDGRGVTTPSGAEVDAPLVRSGAWWQMGGKPFQPAISSDHNANTDEHRWELGQPTRSVRNALAVMQQDRHAFRDGVNPVSGGRKR